jgi:hypothetical protein
MLKLPLEVKTGMLMTDSMIKGKCLFCGVRDFVGNITILAARKTCQVVTFDGNYTMNYDTYYNLIDKRNLYDRHDT